MSEIPQTRNRRNSGRVQMSFTSDLNTLDPPKNRLQPSGSKTLNAFTSDVPSRLSNRVHAGAVTEKPIRLPAFINLRHFACPGYSKPAGHPQKQTLSPSSPPSEPLVRRPSPSLHPPSVAMTVFGYLAQAADAGTPRQNHGRGSHRGHLTPGRPTSELGGGVVVQLGPLGGVQCVASSNRGRPRRCPRRGGAPCENRVGGGSSRSWRQRTTTRRSSTTTMPMRHTSATP